MTLKQWLRVLLHRAKRALSGIIRSRSVMIDNAVYRVHSVFRKDGSLPKRLLTLMENDSKATSDPPSENIPDSSVKSLDSDGNL